MSLFSIISILWMSPQLFRVTQKFEGQARNDKCQVGWQLQQVSQVKDWVQCIISIRYISALTRWGRSSLSKEMSSRVWGMAFKDTTLSTSVIWDRCLRCRGTSSCFSTLTPILHHSTIMVGPESQDSVVTVRGAISRWALICTFDP